MIGSKVIEHSVSNLGNEIITWEISIPKWLLAEFNTHKIEIERVSASSRAVPTRIIVDMIRAEPVMPHEWRYNAKGMQGGELLDERDEAYANDLWLEARDLMIEYVSRLGKLPSGKSADKQRVNRLLEPWMRTVVVCTMTSGGRIGMNNFFGLRDNEAAQPEFHYIAHMMHEQYHTNKPIEREWHLPYVDRDLLSAYNDPVALALVSSARCGRVTHYKQGQSYPIEEEILRGKSFFENGHFSPLRHAANAGENQWYGNMYGWNPISKLIAPRGNDYVEECCSESKSNVRRGNSVPN